MGLKHEGGAPLGTAFVRIIADNGHNAITDEDFTLTTWYRTGSITTSNFNIVDFYDTATNQGFRLQIRPGGIRARVRNIADTSLRASNQFAILANTDYCIVWAHKSNGGGVILGDDTIYFNGVAQIVDNLPDPSGALNPDQIRVQTQTDDVTHAIHWDLRLYKKVFTQPEAEAMYKEKGADNIVEGIVSRWLLDDHKESDTVLATTEYRNLYNPQNKLIVNNSNHAARTQNIALPLKIRKKRRNN
jgi:hypothetical protein